MLDMDEVWNTAVDMGCMPDFTSAHLPEDENGHQTLTWVHDAPDNIRYAEIDCTDGTWKHCANSEDSIEGKVQNIRACIKSAWEFVHELNMDCD